MKTSLPIRLLLCLATAALLGPPARAASARSLVKRGNEAYSKKNYSEALNAYQQAEKLHPDSPRVLFNKGDALYRKGDFQKAMEAYEQAAALSRDSKLEAWSKFNQGNAAFRQGLHQAQASPSQALDSITRSVRAYRDALRADPSLNDARHNIELARRVIEQLRRQLKKQPRRNKQNNNSKKQQNRNQQQQQAGNRNQDRNRDKNQQQNSAQQNRRQQKKQQQTARQRNSSTPRATENPKDILRKERENRKRRRLRAAVGIQPVEKDW